MAPTAEYLANVDEDFRSSLCDPVVRHFCAIVGEEAARHLHAMWFTNGSTWQSDRLLEVIQTYEDDAVKVSEPLNHRRVT